jgi:lysophospholipase L1-like esterase
MKGLRLIALAVLFAIPSAIVATPGAAAAAAIPNPLGGPYVALGDSFSSGEGAPPYLPGTDVGTGHPIDRNHCHRSSLAYPSLVAATFGVPAGGFQFWACSGAVVANVVGPLALGGVGQWDESVQLGHVNNQNAKLVTISIGGNDANFGAIAHACIGNTTTPPAAVCTGAIARLGTPMFPILKGGGLERLVRVGLMVTGPTPCPACTAGIVVKGGEFAYQTVTWTLNAPSLTSLYNQIATLAPNAQIRVVLYPPVLPAAINTPFCQLRFGKELPAASVAALADFETKLNGVVSAAVAAAGNPRIVAVDPTARFAGRTLCNTVVTRRNFHLGGMVTLTESVGSWFNEIVGTGNSESFHPNAAGQAALAAAVNAS